MWCIFILAHMISSSLSLWNIKFYTLEGLSILPASKLWQPPSCFLFLINFLYISYKWNHARSVFLYLVHSTLHDLLKVKTWCGMLQSFFILCVCSSSCLCVYNFTLMFALVLWEVMITYVYVEAKSSQWVFSSDSFQLRFWRSVSNKARVAGP